MTDLAAAIEFLRREGQLITGAPLLAVLLGFVCFCLGWIVSRMLTDERVKALSAQVADLRQRLAVLPSKARYHTLSNEELVREGERILARLASFNDHLRISRMEEFDRLAPHAGSDDADSAGHPSRTGVEELQRRRNAERDEFVTRYRDDALTLRDEIETRLPVEVARAVRSDAHPVALEHGLLVGPDPIGDVVTYLSRLMTRLPRPDDDASPKAPKASSEGAKAEEPPA